MGLYCSTDDILTEDFKDVEDTTYLLINMTIIQAKIMCSTGLIKFDGHVIISVRPLKIDGKSQQFNKNIDHTRVNVVLINNIITEILYVS